MKKKFCPKCFVIGFVALAAVAAGFFASEWNKPAEIDLNAVQSSLRQATLLPANFKQIPDFSMLDQNEKTIGPELFSNKWSLVFFGYTHCPDVCPNSMSVLQQAKKLLAQKPELPVPQIIFVSVDPRRDTPQLLKSYMGYFDESFIGVSGDEANTLKLSRTLGIVYKLEDGAENKENYLVDHSAAFLLINPEGSLQALLSAPHDARTVADDYTRIVEALS